MYKKGYTYILANKKNGVLYVGVTNDICRRAYEHKQGWVFWFTRKYNVKSLVYFEEYENIRDAIIREKQLKAGNRKKKIELIESSNPERKDLSRDL